MKYIREYNHEFYYEISKDEYQKFKDDDIKYLSIEDYDNIRQFITNIDKKIIIATPHISERRGIEELSFSRSIHYLFDNYGHVNKYFIQYIGDEWYLCGIKEKDFSWSYYKCDQLEGLFKFLKDNLAKYKNIG